MPINKEKKGVVKPCLIDLYLVRSAFKIGMLSLVFMDIVGLKAVVIVNEISITYHAFTFVDILYRQQNVNTG